VRFLVDSPQGVTIFDQDDSQDQQAGSEVTFSKNTIKAMRLLQREFERTSNESGSRRLREKATISYETVAGKVRISVLVGIKQMEFQLTVAAYSVCLLLG